LASTVSISSIRRARLGSCAGSARTIDQKIALLAVGECTDRLNAALFFGKFRIGRGPAATGAVASPGASLCWRRVGALRIMRLPRDSRQVTWQQSGGTQMIFVLINVLIIVVVGALIFYLIDRFVRDGRLANLLKILVVLICLAAILQRLLPALGVSLF
jgi:hypothetical protein